MQNCRNCSRSSWRPDLLSPAGAIWISLFAGFGARSSLAKILCNQVRKLCPNQAMRFRIHALRLRQWTSSLHPVTLGVSSRLHVAGPSQLLHQSKLQALFTQEIHLEAQLHLRGSLRPSANSTPYSPPDARRCRHSRHVKTLRA